MATQAGNTRSRIVGSGHTMLYFNHKRLARLDSFVDGGQSPVTPASPVFSLDDRHPSEIVTSRVLGAGTLTITIREAWNQPVWAQLLELVAPGKSGTVNDLVDLQDLMDTALGTGELMVQMIIDPEPNAVAANPGGTTQKTTSLGPPRGKTFHNCVITDMAETETVELGALTIPKTITLMYTHSIYFTGSLPK